ncbi:MAG: hypoxanthine phosphoribosyltransferase [Phycisphaerales bacterium]
MVGDLERVLIPRERIRERVAEIGSLMAADLARQIRIDSPADHITLVPIMTGSMVFVADLIRELPLKLSIEIVGVSSYPGKSVESKGVSLLTELSKNLAGKHVLIVDDILDSGQTLDILSSLVLKQGPATLRTCVLLRKPGKAKVAIVPDYVGFDIPDEFVVGYGLDYDGFYRNLPDIGVLRRDGR